MYLKEIVTMFYVIYSYIIAKFESLLLYEEQLIDI
jgi:hypothetical protein